MNTQNTNAVNPSFNQTFSSPDKLLVPHPEADGGSAYNAVTALLSQAEATVHALMADGEDLAVGFSLSNKIICNLLWSIQTQISLSLATLDHMNTADHAAKINGGAK